MSYFRPSVDQIHGYVPGEQPQESGWIKLNTNENPYPPSPRVIEALQQRIQGRLNIYPDPLSTDFRKLVAARFNVDPDWVLPANGSDENLTLIMRSFIDPYERVVYPYPSYILYETLVQLQGGAFDRLPLKPDWSWDQQEAAKLIERAKLMIIPNPNSPSGNRWSDTEILSLIPPRGLLVLDEAYGDFADKPHRGELLNGEQGDRLIVTRTFSKSFSLAGIRLGFALAHPDLIAGMRKMKDSYNCDSLSLAAGTAALEDWEWMEANTRKIVATRNRLTVALRNLKFDVMESQANFVWCTHPEHCPKELYENLKHHKILVRLMGFNGVHWPDARGELHPVTGLRITIGTDSETDTLISTLQQILQE